MIIIENLTERHIQYRIDHQVVCVKAGRCLCRKGRRGAVAMSVHVPGGIGRRTGPLNPAVMLLPEAKRDAEGARPKIKIHTVVKPAPRPVPTKTKAEDSPPVTVPDNDVETAPVDSKKESKGGRRGKEG